MGCPAVVLLGQHGSDESDDGGVVREICTTLVRRLKCLRCLVVTDAQPTLSVSAAQVRLAASSPMLLHASGGGYLGSIPVSPRSFESVARKLRTSRAHPTPGLRSATQQGFAIWHANKVKGERTIAAL